METLKNKYIEDKDLIKSISYLKSKDILKDNKVSIKFESVNEAERDAEQRIREAVIERSNELKEEISEIRKGGFELDFEGIRLLEIPLKLKVWEATHLEEDLKKIIAIFEGITPRIKELRKKFEEAEAEKERLEKEKDEKERLEKEGDSNKVKDKS